MRHELGEDYGGVESNGNFWRRSAEIQTRYPGAVVVHQVRDGRKVIRSVLSRKVDRTLEQACETWTKRNERMVRDVPDDLRFRLEDLTVDLERFELLARVFGAERIDGDTWERERVVIYNATSHTRSLFEEWPSGHREIFWSICGPTMRRFGYLP